MRIVVQRTFINVVEDGSSQAQEATVKRAVSAPVASRTGDRLFSSKQEEDTECFDGPLDLAQQNREAKGQAAQEPKTTVTIRNIPLHFTRDKIVQHLNARGLAGQYDFLYAPVDFAKCRNVGYAILNLTSPQHAQRFLAEFDGHSWGEPSEGQTVVGWSPNQGLGELIERYRNSPVMHESMLDGCKPIVLEGGVRVDFPPPTKKVQRLRRLRTRGTSRGRGAPSRSGGGLGADADWAGDAPPGTFAGAHMLLPGLSSAPSRAGKDMDAILASPLLAGLRRTGTEAKGLSECSATPKASPDKKAAWADLQDDDGCSECSTQAPGYFSGALSSDGSSAASDGLAARRRGSDCSAQPWSGSMLAKGLLAAVPEEKGAQPPIGLPRPGSLIEVVGTYPAGVQAVITAVDREEGTYNIQLMHDGCRTRRLKTIKFRHARLLRHAEVGH